MIEIYQKNPDNIFSPSSIFTASPLNASSSEHEEFVLGLRTANSCTGHNMAMEVGDLSDPTPSLWLRYQVDVRGLQLFPVKG